MQIGFVLLNFKGKNNMGIVVHSIGIILIVLIIWWFWLKKAKAEKIATDVIKIMVKDGVYTPSRIEVA